MNIMVLQECMYPFTAAVSFFVFLEQYIVSIVLLISDISHLAVPCSAERTTYVEV